MQKALSEQEFQDWEKQNRIKPQDYGTTYTQPTQETGDNHPIQRTGFGALLGAITAGALSGGVLAPVGAALGGMYGQSRNKTENQRMLDAQTAYNNAVKSSNTSYENELNSRNAIEQANFNTMGGQMQGAPQPYQTSYGVPLQEGRAYQTDVVNPIYKRWGETYDAFKQEPQANATIHNQPYGSAQSGANAVQDFYTDAGVPGGRLSPTPGSTGGPAVLSKSAISPSQPAQSQLNPYTNNPTLHAPPLQANNPPTPDNAYNFYEVQQNPRLKPATQSEAETLAQANMKLPFDLAHTQEMIQHLQSQEGIDEYRLKTFMPTQVRLMNAQADFWAKNDPNNPAAMKLFAARQGLIQALTDPGNGYLPEEWGPILQAHPELIDDASPALKGKHGYTPKQFKGLDGKTYTYKPAVPQAGQVFGKHKAGPAVQQGGASGDVWQGLGQ